MDVRAGTHDGRFAPSPTGPLHVGNLRTALAAWLFARSAGARFVLRVDDLDPDRSRAEYRAQQLADLAALGIDWDEPPMVQSERQGAHERALEQLRAADLTYPCFCTRAEVRAAASAPNAPHRLADHYPGTCGTRSRQEARRRIERGDPWCERLRAGGATLTFSDAILGPVTGAVDDLVVRRRDGVPAYNLACVVDDHAQGVREVVRGDDLAGSTPAQVFLARALGLEAPTYAHVPIVVGTDGARLAKRHGSVTLADLAARGVDALAITRRLLESLGVDAGDDAPAGEVLRTAATEFDERRIPRHIVTFDPEIAMFRPVAASED